MTVSHPTPAYAGPVDLDAYGPYGPGRVNFAAGWNRPRYPFQERVTADGVGGLKAEPGRFHLYLGWGCPWAQRTAIVRLLKGLPEVVSASYLDDRRDGRGWAFREKRGADPVNGFTLLQQAYEATEPGYPGHISVPVLWDRHTGRIASNHFPHITLDLGSAFEQWADRAVQLFPEPLRAEIDQLNAFVYENVNNGTYHVLAATTQSDYQQRRGQFVDALLELDARLADRRYLFGAALTEADVRLWPTLARFDLCYNPLGGISEGGLAAFPHLWDYARDLYQQPAFRDTTDFTAFQPGKPVFLNESLVRLRVEPFHVQEDWEAPHGRERLAG